MTTRQQIEKRSIQTERMQIASPMLTQGYDPNELKELTGISQQAMSKIKPAKQPENKS